MSYESTKLTLDIDPPNNKEFVFHFNLFYVYVHACLYTACASGAYIGQRTVSDPLEWFVNYCVCSGQGTRKGPGAGDRGTGRGKKSRGGPWA